jgi:general secretion pathway protein A
MNPYTLENLDPPMISSLGAPDPDTTIGAEDVLTDLVQPFDATPLPEQPALSSLLPAKSFLEAYGLSDNPFPDCVHPGFFYRTDSHGDAFRSMMLAVEFNASLGMVTGPSGTGKTLVSQLVLQHLDTANYQTVLVLVTPGLSKTGLLREILSELNIGLPVGIARVQDLMKLLSNHIIEMYQRGQRLVLIIDESHLLDAECLHLIRTISNVEIPERKLTTCLLFGESRLARRLEHPGYESLRNRIYMRGTLQPLKADEVGQYVKFRCMVTGRMDPLFTNAAIAELHANSGGICRTLNKLCMHCLIEGAARQQSVIDVPIVTLCATRL